MGIAGLLPEGEKVEAVKQFPPPRNAQKVRRKCAVSWVWQAIAGGLLKGSLQYSLASVSFTRSRCTV